MGAAAVSVIDDQWSVELIVDDRNGVLAALASTFSFRGVSIDSFHTESLGPAETRLTATFAGSARMAKELGRTLTRLDFVRELTVTQIEA